MWNSFVFFQYHCLQMLNFSLYTEKNVAQSMLGKNITIVEHIQNFIFSSQLKQVQFQIHRKISVYVFTKGA